MYAISLVIIVTRSFNDFTGATIEQARTYLQIADGNVEAAVGLFMESNGMDYGVAQDRHDNAGSSSAQTFPASSGWPDDDFTEVRQPIAPRQHTLLGGNDDYDNDRPEIYVRNAGRGMPQGFDMMNLNQRLNNRNGPPNPFENPDAFADGDDADGRLARLFAPPTDLMYHGGFEAMRLAAKTDNKWLMVTLHNTQDFACQTMNRDLWKDSVVKNLVRASFIFNQVNLDNHARSHL